MLDFSFSFFLTIIKSEKEKERKRGRDKKSMREDVDTEFKEIDRLNGALPSSISKEMVAFANTEGGELYIGIANDGRIVGVDDTDSVMTRLSSLAHDTIRPDIMSFIQIRSIEMEGKQVIKITISVGSERPYYLAKEGLRPKGVYVRRGSACLPLNEAGIREMIMETSGKSFEECRSLNQDLTFNSLRNEMASRDLEFTSAQMKTLKLTGSDGLFTNLALLLSDQCTHSLKMAVFQGKDKGEALFRERKEFTGSLLKQLNEAYQFLDFYNKTEATFSHLQRTDQRDYPEDALREALLNSIIHRDYSFSGSTIINIYDNHMEFISLGGLVRGLSMEAIFMGVSQSRNPNLAAIFYRLGLVESYGTGVRKIIRLYQGFSPAPVFQSAEGAFTVQLFNRNESKGKRGEGAAEYHSTQVSEDEKILRAIYEEAGKQGKITRKQVEENFGYGTTKAYKLLKTLCDRSLLVQEKRGKQTVYRPQSIPQEPGSF